MNKKTLRVLEFNKIKELLAAKVQSNLAKTLVDDLKPETDKNLIEEAQRETEEALSILQNIAEPPLYGIYDLSKPINHAKIGGILYPDSLIKVEDSLRVVSALKSFNKKLMDNEHVKSKKTISMIDSLNSVKSLRIEINKAILNENEISDGASRDLKTIRNQIKIKNNQIKSKLDSIINSNKYDKILQDKIITVREGRYVVPVKQESKRFFPGIVHDQSTSGSTLFIEPMAVVDLNNQLKELEVEERKEIEKILAKLSELVAAYSEELIENQALLEKIDFIFAKGKLAIELDATRPKLNGDRILNLKEARHPLLDQESVVPIDIELGEDFNSLVITGPNTGGKTVSIKTVGLLTLMAQSGLHIPAKEDSEIAIFENIYADIGDEQSIEQSLSTFSSHMTNIVDILDKVDEKSLVLFDELGAGTDPTEGAALAMAILDYLLERDIRTIATTHYSQLKLYALSKDGVVNGSVEFDIESLRPTYKLLIGVPGKSNAFEISRRLGLQDYIIEDAKKLVSKDSIEFEDVLSNIEMDRRTMEKDKEELRNLKSEVETLKYNLQKEKEKAERIQNETIRKAKEEARDIVKRAKMESDYILDDIKDIKIAIEKDKERKLQEAKKGLSNSLSSLEYDLAEEVLNVTSKEPPKNLKPGETVKVLSLDQIGTVLTEPDSKGNLDVQVGIMKVNVKVDTLVRAKDEEEEKSYTSTKKVIRSKIDVKSEIDLRGMTLDEALLDLSKYIDDAYLAKIKEAQVIHGKGTGVLRSGIRSYLRTNPYIKDFREGNFNEGGSGVTVIRLK